jgi:hypothetical protein
MYVGGFLRIQFTIYILGADDYISAEESNNENLWEDGRFIGNNVERMSDPYQLNQQLKDMDVDDFFEDYLKWEEMNNFILEKLEELKEGENKITPELVEKELKHLKEIEVSAKNLIKEQQESLKQLNSEIQRYTTYNTNHPETPRTLTFLQRRVSKYRDKTIQLQYMVIWLLEHAEEKRQIHILWNKLKPTLESIKFPLLSKYIYDRHIHTKGYFSGINARMDAIDAKAISREVDQELFTRREQLKMVINKFIDFIDAN